MDSGRLNSERERDLDWETIRQRVTELNTEVEETAEVALEEIQRVWARRAAELAQSLDEQDQGDQVRLVLIRLGREIYGIDAQYVYYVKPTEGITPVPRVPEWVAGVINMRGRILSVVDLRQFFGLPAGPDEGKGLADLGEGMLQLVVIETPDMEIALLVDDVLTVESLPTGQMQDAAGTVRGLRAEYVQGVIARRDRDPASGIEEDRLVVILDLLAVLSDPRLIVHEEIV
ncbi:MAG TPA: hypothetical protein ENN99_00450 [Chloroflexi bacterium]|nr:hypothetical protein [Chloroflexota bacterium]